ncbi:hypothetical protein DM860_012546 [Cuscuta australis]|uniref:Uncharacterized protein n=1 Tax=Cuscuta australis TaxID=267555 RepID=A0A328DC97_9ASTE|nr:hypothetical protein DM860_012546 [Cuscuta australis]
MEAFEDVEKVSSFEVPERGDGSFGETRRGILHFVEGWRFPGLREPGGDGGERGGESDENRVKQGFNPQLRRQRRKPILGEIEHHEMWPESKEESLHLRLQEVERHLEKLGGGRRQVGRALRPRRKAVDGGQSQGMNLDLQSQHGFDPGDVPGGGEEGNLDSMGGQLVGELHKWTDMTKCKEWKHNNMKRMKMVAIFLMILHFFF